MWSVHFFFADQITATKGFFSKKTLPLNLKHIFQFGKISFQQTSTLAQFLTYVLPKGLRVKNNLMDVIFLM